MQTDGQTWVFAYGSLLWRPDFSYEVKEPALLDGWARRFWQGSPDHRGTSAKPGRVLTLHWRPNSKCLGYAYRLADGEAGHIMAALDLREQGGYVRQQLRLELQSGRRVAAVTWVAQADNRHFLGPGSSRRIARRIADAHGPSGTNIDYFRRFCLALDELGAREAHVMRIARWL